MTQKSAEETIVSTLKMLLERRGKEVAEITPETQLGADLELDSLELAELSAALEDELGSDPYTQGLAPETVGQLISFYKVAGEAS